MSANAKPPEDDKPKRPRRVVFKEGDTLVCTTSASCGYKVGGTYKVYLNDNGQKCVRGSDGFEDLLSMLVSSFRLSKGG